MSHGEKKFVIWFALVLLLWRFAEAPAVQSAFIQFLAVGQVPGMDTTLSPKGVFLVLATIFSCSLIIVFWSNIKRSFSRHRTNGQPGKQPDGQKKRYPAGQPVILSKPRPFTATPIPTPKLGLDDKKLPLLYVPSIRPLLEKIRVFLQKTGRVMRKVAAAEYDSLKTIFTFIWKVIVFVAMAVWRFAEPRFRKFDKWLERKLRKNHMTSEILEIIEECWRGVTADRNKTEKVREG